MARLVIPGNPRLRLSTGTRAEYFIFALLVGAVAISIHLNSQGGLMRTFTALIGQPEGVASLYQKEGARHRIIAHIEGQQNATASPVVADFEVVDVEGAGLLVRDQKGTLYQAGNARACPACHIHINRVKAKTGAAIQTETHELRFRDQEIGEVLRALKVPADASVTFTGELILKDAGLLAWPTSLQHFNAVQVSGGEETQAARTAKLRAASLDELKRLSEFFGSGNLLVKAVRDVR
jgi:inner membrane protein